MMVHQNELIFDKIDTQKILDAVKIASDIKFNLPDLSNITKNIIPKAKESIENHYHIGKLEVPNVTNNSGVENLINGLQAKTIQYSKRG